MAEQHRPDDLAPIYARLAYLEARERRRRRPHRVLPLALVGLLVALLPLSLLAADPVFGDLGQAAEVHRADIQALGNAGITTGFDDPTADDPIYRLYDPKGIVTREQMASFLARTAGLGGNPPIANARTAQTATSAGNATTVGGYTPSGLVRVALGEGPGVFDPVGLGSGYKTLAAVTIQAPGAGVVLISGAASFSSVDTCPCRIDVQLRDVAAGDTSPQLFTNLGPTAGAAYQQSITPVWAFPVSGAGPRTFNLEGKRASGTGTPTAVNGAITALFVPFGHDGGTTLGP